ncbi:carcinoembryonic antigen-related cell adhesion molecule 3-like [Rattus rattus]|uniref:carcinoembryonic antigen-related cell adhesion molecule 3-like n=1 Tax=Rattus rattus TaxID=10117 RepID=UPI0013F32099|nr:carcinoembryonic antigen-related cell adhesion molecule 3-like [Rattus rattus]
MMNSLALSCKDCTSWQSLLFTAYLLTCWLLPTTTQVTIESVPSIAVEGETVLLFVHSLPPNILAFYWYRGVRALRTFQIARYVIATKSCVEGPSHRGRGTVLSNGSLLIKSVTRQDSGHYTLQIITTNTRPEIIRAEFFVHSPTLGYRKHLTPSQLSTELVPPRVTENDNIFLLAYNLPEKLQSFFWHKGVHPLDRFKIASHSFLTNSSMVGNAYHDRVIICNDASLMLLNVTQRDTGLYTLRTVSMDLKSEWAIVDVQVNKRGSMASDNRRPESELQARTLKNLKQKLDMCFSSTDTIYYK